MNSGLIKYQATNCQLSIDPYSSGDLPALVVHGLTNYTIGSTLVIETVSRSTFSRGCPLVLRGRYRKQETMALPPPLSLTGEVCSSSGLALAAAQAHLISVQVLSYRCNHGKASEDNWELCYWSGFLRRRQDVAVLRRLRHHSGHHHLDVPKLGPKGRSEVTLHQPQRAQINCQHFVRPLCELIRYDSEEKHIGCLQISEVGLA